MAFIKKYNGTYLIGRQERVYFDSAHPPVAQQGPNKGKIPGMVKKAMAEGKNYVFKVVWKSTRTGDKAAAEKILAQYESQHVIQSATRIDDIRFDEALALVFDDLSQRPQFQRVDTYILEGMRKRWAGRFLGTISTNELYGYLADCQKSGLKATTAGRRLNLLRAIFRETQRTGKYQGPNPFAGFQGPKMAFKARVVTLDNADQKKLLKSCWDPKLMALYESLKETKTRLISLPSAKLKALGYDSKDPDEARILAHLRYQTDPRNLPPRTLQDIVLLTLTYGFRKGEVIGVNLKKGRDGSIEKKGGLRVKNWKPETKRLYVYRSKDKGEFGARPKVTEIKVTEIVADILDRNAHDKSTEDFIFSFPDRSPIADIRWPFDEAVDFAGITVKDMGTDGLAQKLQYRDLRHASTNNLIEAGLPIQEVAYYLGHSSTTMLQTVYYTRRKESQLQEHSEMVRIGMERVLGT